MVGRLLVLGCSVCFGYVSYEFIVGDYGGFEVDRDRCIVSNMEYMLGCYGCWKI